MRLLCLLASAGTACLAPAAALAQVGRRPTRKAAAAAGEGVSEADTQVVDAMKSWIQEAKQASQDLEKEIKYEESDFGQAVPKGEEERRLERLGDLLDEVDPKNASEMADLAAALAQARRRPSRKAARKSSKDVSEADSKVAESVKSWVQDAKQASQDFENEARYEESDFGQAVPKGEEEKKLERLGDLLDGVDPKNASEMADLAAALVDPKNASEVASLVAKLAQARRRPSRKTARVPSEGARDADSKVVEAMKNWTQEANQASQDLEKEIKYEESDFGQAVPKGEEERRLERLGDLLDEVDPKNASEMADLAAALAQARRRPSRKAVRKSSEDVSEADSKVAESVKSWVQEAKQASRDFENEARYEESDFGQAVPKGEEEKGLERLRDILDGVDPKNASEMADLAAALDDPKSASELADLVSKLAQARRPSRKTARVPSEDARDADSKVVEAMKNWTQEAKQASQDLEKEIKYEESDFGQAVPKGEEEKRLERLGDLLDEVDPKNASEMADLAAALAQARRRPTRKAAAASSEDVSEADSKVVDAMKSWVQEAKQASQDLERETKYEDSDFGQAVPKGEEEKRLERLGDILDEGEEEKRLERLGDILDEVDPKNASEMADLAAALVDPKNASEMADLAAALAQARRRPTRKAAAASSEDVSEADSKVVDAMKSWVQEAKQASQDLERETKYEDSDFGQAVPKGEEEKRLERLGDILDEVDPKNASEMADLAAALAQARRRSNHNAAIKSSVDVQKGEEEKRLQSLAEADAKVVEAMQRWVQEAKQASQDLERETEKSDVAESAPKGWKRVQKQLEEKRLERLGRILDGVDPANESEMADLAAALVDPKNTSDVADLVAKLVRARNSKAMSRQETSNQLESAIDAAIKDFPEDVLPAQMEKILERVQGLIDQTDPANRSQLAHLAAPLARPSYITNRIGMPPTHSEQEWTETDTADFWSWLEEAQAANDNPERDFESAEDSSYPAKLGHSTVELRKIGSKGMGGN
ncbi:unnamed protein product [Prorocentrum cordatum]|uniref:Uncharacterized protein n=2 Tax=Prorocentrum cordatum TaxID=2364126 RepID=A0ABN9U5G1_9DINO|nr:unnamed protein product [Polarella glacialis]